MTRSRRSPEFEAWLEQQPITRQIEIRAAERDFERQHNRRLAEAEALFAESMQGYEDTPAGTADKEEEV